MDSITFHLSVCNLWRLQIFDALSEKIKAQGRAVQFVQAGANDGVSGDPIHPYVLYHGWRGALVEPVPYLFERLRSNYKDISGLDFYQVCCGAVEGKLPFYLVEEASEAEQIKLGPYLSSFDKNVIISHAFIIPNLENYIKEVQIDTLRVDTIIERSNIGDLNVLMVDTEGSDNSVVNGLNLDQYTPEIVLIEHKHIRLGNLISLNSKMESYGYTKIWMYEDLLYLRRDKLNSAEIAAIVAGSEAMYKP